MLIRSKSSKAEWRNGTAGRIMFIEINMDGIVGTDTSLRWPRRRERCFHRTPRASVSSAPAALEGLRKAHFIASLGIPSSFSFRQFDLNANCFEGWALTVRSKSNYSRQNRVHRAHYPAAFSSAFMWMANAATVTPSCDSPRRNLNTARPRI